MFYQSSVIKKYLAMLDNEQVNAAWEVYKSYFLNPEIQENIRSMKEEQFQEGFLRELFVKVFGYTLLPSPNYNLITEKKNETDAKKADGAIIRDELESVSNEDQITQQLYKDYSSFKREIFADILANNTDADTPKEHILL